MKKITFFSVMIVMSLLFSKEALGQDLSKFYSYIERGDTYSVTLSHLFRPQLNKASGGEFSDGSGYTWRTGYPLPNPAPNGMYNGKKVVRMSSLFADCENIKSLDLSMFNTSNVDNMDRMFAYCTSLVSINWGSRFDMSQVEYAEAMFLGCSSLRSLDLASFSNQKLMRMENMFNGCSSLESLDLSNLSFSDLLQCTGAFENCGKPATFPSNPLKIIVFDEKAADHFEKFAGSGYDASRQSFIVVNLTKFYTYTAVSGGVKVSLTDAFKTELNKPSVLFPDGSGYVWRTGAPLPNPAPNGLYGGKKVVSMSEMFNECTTVTNLNLLNFNTSNVTDMSCMFQRCGQLWDLLLKFNTSNVNTMSAMFFECSKLMSLDLSSFNTSKVTSIGAMFSNCSSLIDLDLSGFNTSNVVDMGSLFSNCKKLRTVDLKGFDTSKVTSFLQMFSSCSSLISLDLSSFNPSTVTSMEHMFNGCSSLTSLDLSNFSVSEKTDLYGAFYNCGQATNEVPAKGWTKDEAIATLFNTSKRGYIDNSRLLFAKKVDVEVNIPSLEGDNIKLYSNHGVLYISGLEGDNTLSIYRVSGELMSTIRCSATEYNSVLEPGVYVVKINEQSRKAVIY